MNSIKGYPSNNKVGARSDLRYVNVEPTFLQKDALSVKAYQFVRLVGTDIVEASSTDTIINATAHLAQRGDVIHFTSGALNGQESVVSEVAINTITLSEVLPSAPVAAVTFEILRHKSPVVDASGSLQLTATFTEEAVAVDGAAAPAKVKVIGGVDGGGLTQAIKTDTDGELQIDVLSSALPTGAATAAKQDTGNTSLSNIDGKLNSLGQKAMAASMPVVIASDQTAIPVSSTDLDIRDLSHLQDSFKLGDGVEFASITASNQLEVAVTAALPTGTNSVGKVTVNPNAAGNSPGSSTVSTVATLTAPANTVGFILMNLDTSAASIRWRIGAAATSSSGQQLQSGRDTGFIPCSANVSICSESGTNDYDIQWILSA